ncbi:MAG: bifunctional phosphoribosylaminoimidazolecarboxamide formyltransferase/IMP cyclohydrolase [Planctomycetota bacterium]
MIGIRRALLSVSDKAGLVDLAKGLVRHGVQLLSTGGTHKALKEAGLPVTEISAFTGFPEMLDGRVKTLHPKVHGGILHRRDIPEHVQTIAEHGIEPIDLVVVNLYPFEQTVARPGVREEEAIEQIDIGGPSMIRSAAKNHSHVAVLTDPSQYGEFLTELDKGQGRVPQHLLRSLAVAAFSRTAKYDAAIHAYLVKAGAEGTADADLPTEIRIHYQRKSLLRYGENPHQKAAFYVDPSYPHPSLARAVVRHGKELSYNNLLDLDSALSIAREFGRPSAVVIKHNNPCGAAVADTLAAAFVKAYASDPLSAFGSVLGFNRVVDKETALSSSEPGRFVDAIVAPKFEQEAFEILTTRPSWKASVRLLEVGELTDHEDGRRKIMVNRPLEGGLLRQSPDLGPDGFADRKIVTKRAPTEGELKDLAFAWSMVKHVRSNAIVVAKDEGTLGVGAGQMSRVDSVNISIGKAGDRVKGAVLASDAFFPFRDNVDQAAAAGIVAIVQPGGSKRDQESIDACDEHGIAMIFTGMRHFKH